MQFRKKPVVIEAVQWDGTEAGCQRIKAHFPGLETLSKTGNLYRPEVDHWRIGTLEGGHDVSPGDWIIRGVKGEHYPCKPDIFAMTYEPAAARAERAEAAQPDDWREHVEQRIRAWRQRTMNKSGDLLAIDDFMGQDSIDDLVDFVCDEWAEPVAEAAQRVPLTDADIEAAAIAAYRAMSHSASTPLEWIEYGIRWAGQRVPQGWAIESGRGGFDDTRWVCVRNLHSQLGQDFYEDRDPLVFGFLSALAEPKGEA